MKRQQFISALILIAGNLLIGVMAWLAYRAFEYASPLWFWALAFIPLTSILFFFTHRKRTAEVRTSSLEGLRSAPLAQFHRHLTFLLRGFAVALIVIVIARPQSSDSYEDLTREGINIVIAMDVSASMLSMDFEPNRLESAKETAIAFVDARPDDRIGVTVYEGESITQVPLTTDHRVVKNGLAELNTGLLEGGTAIGMGLATAVNRLRDSEGDSKVVILLTDGVNNRGQVNPADAAEMARLYDIRVYTIGVGTIGKARSPIGMRNGRYVFDWVEVEIDEEVLQKIAETTGGKYFRATSESKLQSIYDEIDQLEKTRFNVLQYKRKTEEFMPFLVVAIGILLGEFILRSTLFRSVT
jgi:Ca-activated chloride channel family protein